MEIIRRILICCMAAIPAWQLVSCCSVPEQNFMQKPDVQAKIHQLQTDLVAMLPVEHQVKAAAKQEAQWITMTAFEQSAVLARANKPVFVGWINNNLVNTKILPRGLCWEYQHDLYRELRRKPLKYFSLGLCSRDRGRGTEHNCVYVCARGRQLPDSIVLDPWANCGNLKLIYPKDRKSNWEELAGWQQVLQEFFPEGHRYSNKAHIVFGEENGDKTMELSERHP